MRKTLILFALFLSACSNINKEKELRKENTFLDEKDNQIIIEIVNDIDDMYYFNPFIQWTAVKDNFHAPCYGGGNYIDIYIKDSQILTTELDGYKLKFSYDIEYPYAGATFNLSEDIMLDEDPNNFVLTRLTDQYTFTVSELLENQITIIGEIYNKESNETYIVALKLYKESSW